jgi:hypothetical protein
MVSISIYLILFVIFLVMIMSYFLNNKFHKDHRYTSYVNVIIAIGTFILSLGVVVQVFSYQDGKKKFTASIINSFAKNFTTSIMNLFINHPEMNYFYEEIFLNKDISYQNRNIVLEGQICVNIFNKIVQELSIIDTYKDEPKVEITKQVMRKILDVVFKSHRVRYYYTNLYKPKFAGPLIIDYMQTNFGL